MEALENVNLVDKNLAVSASHVPKLESSEGTVLQVVSNKILDASDDNAESDEEDGFGVKLDLSRLDKKERMRREYLAIVLNANRDFVKPGPKSRHSRLLELGEYNCENDVTFCSGILDSRYSLVHNMYRELGSYDERLKDPKLDYREIVPKLVYKRTISAGVGPLVSESAMVIFNCAMWAEKSSEPFDSTWLRRNTIVSNLATDPILPGVARILLTARQGEWCEGFIKPELAYGIHGAMPRIPPNATIFCLIEVVKVITADKMALLAGNNNAETGHGFNSFEDLLDAANEARTRGNHFFEEKQYKPALQRYKSGIRILDAITYKDGEQEKQGMDLMMKLYNNTARVANALGNPRLALAACKQASLIDDMHPKTYWHRINAWATKGHLDRALGVCRRAMQLFNDKKTAETFVRRANELKSKMQDEKTRADELSRLMGRAILGQS